MSIYPTIKFNHKDLEDIVRQSITAAGQDGMECSIESIIPLALGDGKFELSINLKPVEKSEKLDVKA